VRDQFLQALTQSADNNKDVMFLTADLGYGVFEDFERRYSNQYLNVGVAEQLMTGVATGLALEGKVVFTYSIGNFPTLRCLEQIRNDAAYHDANVNIVASGGGFSYGQLGMSHHATEDLAILRALPGVEVYSPCTADEVYSITNQVQSRKGVSYIRLDKTAAIESAETAAFEFSKLRKFCCGRDVLVVGTGGILEEAISASEELKKENISVAVYGCHSLKPFDSETLIKLSKTFKAIVTLEEHNTIGGLGSLVAETLIENGFDGKLCRIGLNDTYSSVVGDQSFLREFYKMDSSSIKTQIISLVK